MVRQRNVHWLTAVSCVTIRPRQSSCHLRDYEALLVMNRASSAVY